MNPAQRGLAPANQLPTLNESKCELLPADFDLTSSTAAMHQQLELAAAPLLFRSEIGFSSKRS